MRYLLQLTEEELEYICSVIPYADVVKYLNTCPKEFGKIRPGFRPKSIKTSETTHFLLNNHEKLFISNFLEKTIEQWLCQIEERLKHYMDEGECFEFSCLHILPNSPFADNVALYLKLSNKEYSADYAKIMSTAVSFIKASSHNNQENDKLKEMFEVERSRLNGMIDNRENSIRQITKKSRDKDIEIVKLTNDLILAKESIEKSTYELESKDKQIQKLEKELKLLQCNVKEIKAELVCANEEKNLLNDKLRSQIEQEQFYLNNVFTEFKRPKHPCNIDEFEEFFEFNLNALGISKTMCCWELLMAHLDNILFCGKPILIKSSAGINLARCVANTLCGKNNIEILKYSSDLSNVDISKFLCNSERVVCFEGFIGNYNELELLSVINCVRNKIVFITFNFDGTLRYISDEILTAFNYLNLNRIGEFSIIQDFEEDPSIIEECEFDMIMQIENSRYKKICREILEECGVKKCIVESLCAQVNSEQDLCRMLAFVFLPYISDVMDRRPYNCSKRLQKYAGESGKCPEKELMIRWFG